MEVLEKNGIALPFELVGFNFATDCVSGAPSFATSGAIWRSIVCQAQRQLEARSPFLSVHALKRPRWRATEWLKASPL